MGDEKKKTPEEEQEEKKTAEKSEQGEPEAEENSAEEKPSSDDKQADENGEGTSAETEEEKNEDKSGSKKADEKAEKKSEEEPEKKIEDEPEPAAADEKDEEILLLKTQIAAMQSGVKPDCIDDAVAIAESYVRNGKNEDINSALAEVVKKYPDMKANGKEADKQGGFKVGADDSGSGSDAKKKDTAPKKRWNRFN
ncbi:MAG: hypothetical protein IJ555_00545 [Ruminococcus sp.]|nr:hypothetical protein [Ruminococcus sp.]